MSSAQVETFGAIDGVDIPMITLTSLAGAKARVLAWGAVIHDLIVPSVSGPQRVVLGLNSIEDYQAYSPYFGAIAGRFANRIAGGRFTLGGVTHDLLRNERGITTLHGGPHGFGTRIWTVRDYSANAVRLTLHSDDGDQGFPGALDATCTYTLLEPATLRVELAATTDAATVVNLTNHSYFNLDGSADILDHEMTILADQWTPNDADSIPTGEIAAVEGTPFDFRQPRSLRHASGQTYDANYVLRPADRPGELAHAATVRSAKNGIILQMHTDQPGVQFYDAAFLNCPVPGLGGAAYGPFAGLCLEAQRFPNAPNQPNFPSSVLRPGELYSHTTEYRFS